MAESSYRREIRAAVRALWLGLFTVEDFFDSMDAAIHRNLRLAFIAGAKECGINPAEFTPEERQAMRKGIQNELGFIWGFGLAIEVANKASGGKMGQHMIRAETWINRYREAKNRGRILACSNRKMLWRVGPTEHCIDCLNVNGKVKRGSQFLEAGFRPQSAALACSGFRCQCSLTPTDLPMSRGPLPRLVGP